MALWLLAFDDSTGEFVAKQKVQCGDPAGWTINTNDDPPLRFIPSGDRGDPNYLIKRVYISSGGQYFGTLWFRNEVACKNAEIMASAYSGIFRRWFAFLQYLTDEGFDFKVSM